MILSNRKLVFMILSFFLATSTVFAHSTVEFFASNNTKVINLATAYKRLTGKEQLSLQHQMINLMQKNHIEQGKFEDILGTYEMSNSQQITGDNSERFNVSPYQKLSDNDVFSLAKNFAIQLNQESVAVFIPNQLAMGQITVQFTFNKPTINETVNIVQTKLPSFYGQAFSLHLINTCGGFDFAKVSEIEWLGSKINVKDIQQAFPNAKIKTEYGFAYLVYQNGQVDRL